MKATILTKTLATFVLFLLIILQARGQGHETFDNLNASGASYTANETSFEGENGVTWYHRGTRLISETSEYAITGITCGFGSDANDGYPGYVKATLTGGVGELSFNWRSYFTGGNQEDRSVKVFINGIEKAEFALAAMDVIYNESVVVNIPGNVLVELRVSGTRQIAVDNIEWTTYTTDDPLLTTYPLYLENFTYQEGNGPSASKYFDLSGFNLEPESGDITIEATENFEVSVDDVNFNLTATLSYTAGEIVDIPVYIRLIEGLNTGDYEEEISVSGGNSSTSVSIQGTVTPFDPELTFEGYQDDFSSFISAETFPAGWKPDDSYSYQGDFGSGTAGGLRGNGALGFQLTASGINSSFKATLTLINSTGGIIENLDISYLGKVARDVDGTPKWVVSVNETEIPELEYSTASGENELKSHLVTGLNIEDGSNIVIEWFTTSDETVGTRRQIGITDVSISVSEDEKVANPEFDPSGGTFLEPFFLEITTETDGATIFYKYDEEDPWTEYTEELEITATTTVWSQATKDGMIDSDIVSAEYEIPEGNIQSVQDFDGFEVDLGTTFEELTLPEQVSVTLDDANETVVELEVEWAQGDYDGNTEDTYTLTGDIIVVGAITNTDELTARIEITVVEEIEVLKIVSVQPLDAITVDFGTSFEELPLPETATVTLENDDTEVLDVIWQEGNYDPETPGTYTLEGELQLIEGVTNPDEVKANIDVTVLEEIEASIIAKWNYNDDTPYASEGIDANIGNITLREDEFDGTYSYINSADGGRAISTSSWHNETYNKYWVVEFTTSKHENLNLSSVQRSSNTGPADFKAQYRIGNTGDWTDVIEAVVSVENNYTTGVLSDIALPDVCNNKPSVFIRWVTTSNTSVTGDNISSGGTSAMDKIIIKGDYSEDLTNHITFVQEFAPIEVEINTPFEEIDLPEHAAVTLDDDSTIELEVNWLVGDYDPEQLGIVTVYADIILTEGIENPDGKQAEIEIDVVEEIIPEYKIVAVEDIDAIEVPYGTTFNNLSLPETVTVTLENDDTEVLDVIWQEGNYDPETPDTYNIEGELQLIEGITNPDEHTANINVTVLAEDTEITIVGWTFPEAEMFGANLGIEENVDKPISREEGFTGSYSFPGGVSGQSISTSGWDDGEGSKYWTVEFSTLNYKELNLSSAQQSSNTGPRDFKVQYRIGDQEWVDVVNSQVTVANDNFTSGVLEELPLPAEMQNKASVSLRWIMTSNISVTDGTVASGGTSRIDNIFIKGLYDSDFIRIVSGVEEPASISVEQGTAFNDLNLPETVTVHFEDLGSEILGVEWLEGNYDPNLLGEQTIEGNLQLEGNMDNPDEIKAEITVVVMEEILNITQVQEFDPVMVYPGVDFENLDLPEQAQVTLSDDSTTLLDINWMPGDYDPEVPDTYNIQGDLVLETGINNPDNLKAEIDVVVTEPDVVAGWTFPVEDNREANLGVDENTGNLISREDDFEGSYTFHDGVTDYSVGTVSWADGQDTKYWQVEFSTTGYKDLVVSSAQYSTAAGPRDFKIQYRLGTQDWQDVPDTDITVASNFTEGVVDKAPLPEILQNKPSVSLRWIMTSNIRSSGEGEVTTGRSQIDNILIEGMFSDEFKLVVIDVENPDPVEVESGTSFNDLGLPGTVTVFFDNGSSDELTVSWQEEDYDGNTDGVYTITGEIEIDEETMENPLNIKAEVEVTVSTRYQVTFNLDMSEAPGFDPNNDQVFIRGTMNDWAIPGTDPETQLLEPLNNKSLIYTITFQLEEGTYEYKYYINAGLDNPEGGDNRSIDVDDDQVVNDTWVATGITETLKTTIKIYPNPAKSHINISSEYLMNQVRIINLQGQVVLNHEIQDKFYTIATDGLTGGIYFIEVTTQDGIISEKLIINK